MILVRNPERRELQTVMRAALAPVLMILPAEPLLPNPMRHQKDI